MVASQTNVIIDTGPLVAYLNKRDRYHAWAKEQLQLIKPPLITCEAVLSETCFLIGKSGHDGSIVLKLLERDLLKVGLAIKKEHLEIQRLLKKYARVPMSLADACLVRLSELNTHTEILTIDSDFRIYRRNGRHIIPVIMPT